MTVKQFLENTFDPDDEYQVRERIYCKDGFSVSVQGGTKFFYCEPRDKVNIYDKVELGYPSEIIHELNKYAEDKNTKDTVFGFVPIEKVEELIEKHGGIDDK